MNYDFQVGDIINNKYLVLSRINKGHFGQVYKCKHQYHGRISAVKLINAESFQNFSDAIEEAKSMLQCENSFILPIYDVDSFATKSKINVYIDMLLVNGGSLAEKIENGDLNLSHILKCMTDIIDAVDYIHSKNLIHRDIKPANILFDGSRPQLSDFGLVVKFLSDSNSLKWYTPHCPPEYHKSGTITQSADIYALGVTLFRALTGNNDFSYSLIKAGAKSSKDYYKFLKLLGYPEWINKKLKRIINKATNEDPDKRYKNASEFRNAINRLHVKIDWEFPADPKRSIGYYNNKFECYATPNECVVKKNGRRVNQDCVTCSSISASQNEVSRYVNVNTFES